jgi:PAS domain S-box-containing protein
MSQRKEKLSSDDLRAKIDQVLEDRSKSKVENSSEEIYLLLGESLAHQIELEEQNDELQHLIENREQGFRAVAQTSNDAIITIDHRGKIVFWNNASESIFGYPKDEAIGKSLSFIMPERLRGNHQEGIERVVSTSVSKILGTTVEMTGLRCDGNEFPLELSLSRWNNNGDAFFTGIIRDITERKRFEQEVESLARFPSENQNPVLRASQDGTILYANDGSQPLLNLWESQVGQKLPENWCQMITEVISTAQSRTEEVNCEERIYALDITPIVEAGYVTFYGNDVTERVQFERLLNDRNQFITTVFESLSYPFYVINSSDYTIQLANSAACADELPASLTCYNLLHNQEIPCSKTGYLCPLEEVKKTKRKVIVEHDHIDDHGNIKTLEVHAYPIFDHRGEVSQMIEYSLNITQRKQLEQALQQNEKKYRQLFELAREGIWVLDNESITTFTNPRMAEILGYSVEEMQGMHLFSFMDEQGVEISKKNLERRQQGIDEQHDFEFLRKDGSRVYTSLETSPITDEDGNYLGALAIVADITERKQMEEALQVRTHALGERVKELNCLYKISALVEKPGVSLDQILQGTVEIIPPAWQYPEITGARIILDGQEFRTENFSEDSLWKQLSEIKTHGQRTGSVQICYTEERDGSDEGPFLYEERSLINAIARHLGRIVERIEGGEALQTAHDDLEQRVQERTTELEIANQMLQGESVERKRAYEAEQSARQVAETLTAASQALTQTLEMDTVLNTLLDYLERLIPFESANIALLGDEACLSVRAVRGYESGMEAEEIISQNYNIEQNHQIRDILTSGESLKISDLRQQPGWKTYLELEKAGNWMGVPLVVEGKVIGLCGIDKSEAGYFSEEHLNLAETLVSLATAAIENAWLFEQVRAGRERLQSLSRRLVDVQESERLYIARELHDEAGQALTSLKVGLHLLERDAKRPEAVIAGVAELKLMADEILENLHRLAMDLRPASLDHLGLVAALRQYVETVSDKHGLTVQFETIGFDDRLPLDVETALYRIVQEAMTNVVRHAQATRADVILERIQDKIVLIVEDNGVGINFSSLEIGERLGIVGMRERTEMLGGEFEVERTAGSGTTVLVEVPYGNTRADRG